MDFNKANGLWQFHKMIVDTTTPPTSSGISDQYTFHISKELITISLFSEHLTNRKSEDDVYLLITRWQKNTLLYLPPFGEWTPLADFDGEVFYQSDGQSKRIFKKIKEEEAVTWNKPILKKGRLPFDYSIRK